MSRAKNNQAASPHFPTGSRSIHFDDLEEECWWALLHALEVRIRYFDQQRAGYVRLDDPGLQRHIDCCDETLDQLRRLLATAQQQIAPAYWPPSPEVSR